ncbi:hypothetical protein EOA32_01040 [Mesorhizobium sp. M1A.F.Ca.ET.072.01.1.1]|uniref:hypothetical protein n=1 Tax=Mesorhizobium sp. M1A.F.Ca.ET.072.01.1.1 TaxID=2496753 RepID=UPI000FD1C16C|nr:hypothetical protein [Mesorhizobium sp. M1A.F.Ca.ET.072.01.1.1]RUW55635.1 hypothetical protein EOA32_01040 [Mesorhizobium sp. M1A.F.Ca.ET.072.01.1.1]
MTKSGEGFAVIKVRGKPFVRKVCRDCISIQRKKRYYSNHEANKAKMNDHYARVGRFRHKRDYEANKETFRAKSIERNGTPQGRAYNMWKNARSRSGEEFDVPREKILNAVVNGVCERSGIPFDFSIPKDRKINRFAPSIDKIDRTKGYTADNVQVVVWCYNTGKGEATDDQFIAFCKVVAEYNK